MKTRKFGLLGKEIDYSFSRGYFSEKFKAEDLNATYENFDFQNIELVTTLLNPSAQISGINITIPYKESIIPYLDELQEDAVNIGAVNTVKLSYSFLKPIPSILIFLSRNFTCFKEGFS